MNNNKEISKEDTEMNKTNEDKLGIKEGRLTVRFINKKGECVDEKYLGNNLVVNNSKMVLTHLMGQQSSGNVQTNVAGYDPRVLDTITGGLKGNVDLNSFSFNPTAAQLRPLYMAFGSNQISTTFGPNPSIEQCGLYNVINKNGVQGGTVNTDVSTYLYGGTSGDNAMVTQFLSNDDPAGAVSDAWIRFIVTIKTYQGQIPGGYSQIYREAGLFTDMFYPHTLSGQNQQVCPIMIARKTFPDITKTAELELQWVWELRF